MAAYGLLGNSTLADLETLFPYKFIIPVTGVYRFKLANGQYRYGLTSEIGSSIVECSVDISGISFKVGDTADLVYPDLQSAPPNANRVSLVGCSVYFDVYLLLGDVLYSEGQSLAYVGQQSPVVTYGS